MPKKNIVRMAGMAAAMGPVIGIIGKLTTGVGKYYLSSLILQET